MDRAITIGGIAGWLAEQFMKSEMGLLLNIVLGMIGAAVASWLFGLLGVSFSGWIGYLIAGFVGAVILIAIGRALSGHNNILLARREMTALRLPQSHRLAFSFEASLAVGRVDLDSNNVRIAHTMPLRLTGILPGRAERASAGRDPVARARRHPLRTCSRSDGGSASHYWAGISPSSPLAR